MDLSDSLPFPSREDVSDFLRAQRRGNRKKACFPCHQRKVGCDDFRPCKRCVDREHPSICTYEPPETPNKKRKAASIESAAINSAQRRTERAETTSISIPSVLTPISRGLSGESTLTPPNQFVGGSSVPGFILNDLSRMDERELGMSSDELRSLLLPALGLARIDCASSIESEKFKPVLLRAVEALPRSPEVIRLFQQYKQVVYPLNPHILDLPTFESELVTFLTSIEQVKSGQSAGTSLPWTAIMLAVIAAGLQFSDLSSAERASGSKRYVRQAFECLHAEFGFITASIPTITAILILVTVLQNDLATEAAWSYLGLASRLAQSLGLHNCVSLGQSADDSPECSLWKAIVWQDCLLSMCFGRQPCTSTIKKRDLSGSEIQEQGLEYRSVMYLLASTSLDLWKEDITSPAQLTSQVSQIQAVIDKAKPELRIRATCHSIEDHTAHLAFRLNTSFALATFLRQSLEFSERWQVYSCEQTTLRSMCIDACVAAVESFIDLHNLSVVAERSWAMLHNGLSCTLLLLLVDEARTNEKIQNLQQQLLSIMSQSSRGGDQSSLLWGPHARVLTAMKLLGTARSGRPSATPPVQGAFSPSAQRIDASQEAYGNESGEAMTDQGGGFSNGNNDNSFYDLSNLDLNQHSLGTLYDTILWGDYQTM